MEQAIRDSGVEEKDISNPRTGIVMGSGGPSTAAIVEAADITREKGSPKRIGPFAVPKAMSSTASATLATWFKIKGVNYSISSACATSNHCIGNGSRADPVGQAGHGVRRRLGGAELDHVEFVRRHGRDVVEIQRHAAEGLARLRQGPRRLRHRRRRRRAGAGRARARQGARRQDLRRGRRLWRDLGRLRHGGAVGRGRACAA